MKYMAIKRPALVTIICVMGFIFIVLFSMGMMFSPETKRLGDFFPALFGLLVTFRFIALIGIWYMKRWGVELFMITFGATIAKGILMDDLSVLSVVWHALSLIYLAIIYRKMDRNL
jgi:hypothetical protein